MHRLWQACREVLERAKARSGWCAGEGLPCDVRTVGRNERRNPGARGHRGAWVVEMIETLKRRKVEAERSLKFEISLGYTSLRPCLKKTKKQKAVYARDR